MRCIWMPALALLMCLDAFAQGATNSYTQTNLVSDIPGLAVSTDSRLVNPWGLSRPSKPTAVEPHWWAADQATGVTTLYNADGTIEPLIITIPSASGQGVGSPAGAAFFSQNFAFASLDGVISNWNAKTLPAQPGTGCARCHPTSATVMVNRSSMGAVYTGMTIANNGGTPTYYVANAAGAVEAYDTSFNPVTLSAGAFVDPNIPSGFKPFGIQTVGSRIYVTFMQAGPGGYVDAFDVTGTLLLRLQQGWFNKPWGIAPAPANFGVFSGALLVGNTGSGKIGAYHPVTGKFLGFLKDSGGNAITNSGLWAISFGAGNAESGPTNVLYFAAGIQNYAHGLFGSITAN